MLERLEDVGHDELDVWVVEVNLCESVGEGDGKVFLEHDLCDVEGAVVVSLWGDARPGGEQPVAQVAERVQSAVADVNVVGRGDGVSDRL